MLGAPTKNPAVAGLGVTISRSGLVARRERPCSLRAECRLGGWSHCRFRSRGSRGSGCGRCLLGCSLLCSLLGGSLFGSSLFRNHLLGSSLFRSNLFRSSLLRCGLLDRSLLCRDLFRRCLLGGYLLRYCLLRSDLLHCCLLGRGLRSSRLLGGRFLCHSFFRSCHYILLDQVAKAPIVSGAPETIGYSPPGGLAAVRMTAVAPVR